MSFENNHAVYERGDVLFSEDDPAKFFYIVKSGKVACAKKGHDRLVITYIAGKGDLVAEETVLSFKKNYVYSAVALSQCRVVKIKASDAQKVIKSKGEWIGNILENLGEKIKNTTELISEHRIEDDRLYADAPLSEEDLLLIKSQLA
ncbi:MAG: cyclic nucleotide-binding domain-containing protein [Bacteriovoracaceae bacterium]|nr:cyclic nucleotide-binding domain-containing protein [Bacteriovoracaceae bacterium]